jgi:hypothetical protein
MRGDLEILDPRFPPLHVLHMMNKEEYMQYQKEFLQMESEAAKGREKREDAIKEAKIKRDIPVYARECYGFRCLNREQQVDFAMTRLDFNKITSVIRYATSTKARMVLLGDFPRSSAQYAIHPEVIVFVKTMKTNHRTWEVECDSTEARTPMIGPLAKATYSKTWLAADYQKILEGSSTQVPDPLCLYESSRLYDKLTQEEKEKHSGNIHLNITRHVYLGIPTTTPNQENQFGEVHSSAFEIPPLQHPENYTTFFEEYNQGRVLSYHNKKPQNPIRSKADAEQALKTALQLAHDDRVLITLLPDRGSSTKIKDNLEAAIKKHVQDISWLYQELIMQAITLEVAIMCAEYPGTLWSSGVCLAQDPRGIVPVQDYAATLTRAKEFTFNNDLQLQSLLHSLLLPQREVLRYETLMHVITLALSTMIEAHNRLLHYICLPFSTVINDNYKKDNNFTSVNITSTSEHVMKLRTATAALVYYAPVTARANTKNAANIVYSNLCGLRKSFDPLPFPFLTETLGLKFEINEASTKKIHEMQQKAEAGKRLKAGFERQYNIKIPDHPVSSAATPTITAVSPAPIPQLLSLAQQIPFQQVTSPSLPKDADKPSANTKGLKNKSNQVPHLLQDTHYYGTVPISHHFPTTNHVIMLPSKRPFPAGDPITRPLKKQRPNAVAHSQCPRVNPHTTQQPIPRFRKTPRKFQAYQHRTVSGEHHEVRCRRFIHGFQWSLGRRSSEEEAPKDQEDLKGITTSSNSKPLSTGKELPPQRTRHLDTAEAGPHHEIPPPDARGVDHLLQQTAPNANEAAHPHTKTDTVAGPPQEAVTNNSVTPGRTRLRDTPHPQVTRPTSHHRGTRPSPVCRTSTPKTTTRQHKTGDATAEIQH